LGRSSGDALLQRFDQLRILHFQAMNGVLIIDLVFLEPIHKSFEFYHYLFPDLGLIFVLLLLSCVLFGHLLSY